MQIIIPMSGFGERFRQAGYTVPKPLIEVDGKPIIEYVIEMFPGETDFLFICNEDHLNQPAYRMREILTALCPTGKIVGIPSHKKGPVFATLQASKAIKLDQPVIVNYCDFTCYWDWKQFRRFVENTDCVGAIPAYKGFHPHTLGNTHYAYMRENNGWVQDIQEKQPFTDNRMDEYASSGTYYFSSGQLMKDTFEATIAQNLNTGGEYYVSLAYKPLLQKGAPIAVYPLQHFMQWGTPDDLQEYLRWSDIFKQYLFPRLDNIKPNGSMIIPMAGLGERFSRAGYTIPKPLIPVSGKPMVLQATQDLPPANNHIFILRSNMPDVDRMKQLLLQTYPDAIFETVPQVTQGQALTALLGLDVYVKQHHNEIEGPITFGACDNGAIYSHEKVEQLLQDDTIDIIVWGVRGHPHASRHPHMYGWIDSVANKISAISVKQPLSNPKTDPIVLGTFTFKYAKDYRACVDRMIQRQATVNGEFYIDTCINDAIALGLNCHLFEVDHFICWGTPNDLSTFEYWQSCFHKWNSHPYHLNHDKRIPEDQLAILDMRYEKVTPHNMEMTT